MGIWRLIESLDRHGIRASVMLNSDVGERYPQIIEAGRARNWAWVARGKNNSLFQADMTPDEERAFLTEVVGAIEKTTGHRPAAGSARPSPRRSKPRSSPPNWA
ncbi:hypothetical protein ACO0M4_15370 [Streptomyces sp. RGM 3693]|uniref:hypothetical protein n=1 Tax=Streptomyces sp. RGM 3693 TaxID=3413284 RepID=UPI003D2BBA87